MYLQLPLRQWGAGNVYLLVLSSIKVNIAKNPIAVMGLEIVQALFIFNRGGHNNVLTAGSSKIKWTYAEPRGLKKGAEKKLGTI